MLLANTTPLKSLNLRELGASPSGDVPALVATDVAENAVLSPPTEEPPKFIPTTTPPPTSHSPILPLDALTHSAPTGAELRPAPDCGHHECRNGHQWAYALAHGGCPGCKRGIFGIGLSNCPQCNEPPLHTLIRIDYSGEKIGFSGRCRDHHNSAETHYITITRAAALAAPALGGTSDQVLPREDSINGEGSPQVASS